MKEFVPEQDKVFLRKAIDLACDAEKQGNLPIGALLTLDRKVIAIGQNAIWIPAFNGNRHAEIEALRNVPKELWGECGRMTLYTTLEPCLMCLGAILLHGIGRVVFGAVDDYGGASVAFGHLPLYFQEELAKTEWVGPALPEACDILCTRVRLLEKDR